MSMFPDCRVDGVYNADFLDRERKAYVSGFQTAVEEVISL